jgi:hypothetical protein
MNWGMNEPSFRRPDKARSSANWDQLLEQTPSGVLRESMQHMNPPLNAKWECAVMLFDSFTSPFYWYSVPCNKSVEGALPLCEAKPTATKPRVGLETLGASLVDYGEKIRLKMPRTDCNGQSIPVGKKHCFLLGRKAQITTEDTAMAACQEKWKPFTLTKDLYNLLTPTLENYVRSTTAWGFRIAQDRILEFDGSSNAQVFMLVPTTDPTGHTKWTIDQIHKNDAETNNILGYMCTKERRNATEKCAPHQFE